MDRRHPATHCQPWASHSHPATQSRSGMSSSCYNTSHLIHVRITPLPSCVTWVRLPREPDSQNKVPDLLLDVRSGKWERTAQTCTLLACCNCSANRLVHWCCFLYQKARLWAAKTEKLLLFSTFKAQKGHRDVTTAKKDHISRYFFFLYWK